MKVKGTTGWPGWEVFLSREKVGVEILSLLDDRRSEQAQAYRRLYGLARWKRTRKAQLDKQPLCENCLKHGRYTPATVCDHIDPDTKLDPETFFLGPFQSLCDAKPWRCHSSGKQREEHGGAPMPIIGLDGWPEGS